MSEILINQIAQPVVIGASDLSRTITVPIRIMRRFPQDPNLARQATACSSSPITSH